MCLSIPGKVEEITGEGTQRSGRVNFGGITKDITLSCVPEAKVGDYVLVHVGFAISVIDEAEAHQSAAYLKELDPEAYEELKQKI
jgi:hydrogenase expression/formation protein HypC